MQHLNTWGKFSTLMLIMVSLAIGSTQAGVHKRKKNSYTGQNPWSIGLAIDGRTEVNNDDEFEGVRLSIARDLDRYTSVRLNLGGFQKGRDFRNGVWIDSDRYSYEPFDWHRFDVDGGYISLQYLFYPSRNRRFDFFLGFGPRLSAEEGDPGTFAIYNGRPFQSVDYIDTERPSLLGAGFESTAGAEWFIGRNFSLVGEYGFVVQHQWYLVEVDYIDDRGRTFRETETFADGWHVDRGHVKLGFAMYF